MSELLVASNSLIARPLWCVLLSLIFLPVVRATTYRCLLRIRYFPETLGDLIVVYLQSDVRSPDGSSMLKRVLHGLFVIIHWAHLVTGCAQQHYERTY
jgi:hypothetical protein